MINSEAIMIIAISLASAACLGWLLPERWQMPAVSMCGAGLLGAFSLASLAFLTAGTLASAMLVGRRSGRMLTTAFIVLVAGAYGALLLFAGPLGAWGLPRWVVPLGMAYYVLRLIHYVLDGDRGLLRPHRWRDAFFYQFFPPVLVVGPINRFGNFLRDVHRRRWDPTLMSTGLGRVMFGSAKIVLIGNYLIGQTLPTLIHQVEDPGLQLYAKTLLFWANIYVQFSGYSDVAIGFGAVLGFALPENFHWPFLARNIGEFWQRWHITLSHWCRDYVYMPVLAQWRRPVIATATSMLVLGLWHQASMHYLLWGLYHATGLTVWRRFAAVTGPAHEQMGTRFRALWNAASWVLTLHFVMFSYPVANAIESAMVGR